MAESKPRRGNPSWAAGEVPPGAKPFPKGVSGNPRGASRRARLVHLLNQQLNEIVDGDPKGRTAGELVMRALIKEAMRGNVRAAEICMDRIDGKVPQTTAKLTHEQAAQTLADMLGVDVAELLAGNPGEPDEHKEPTE